MSDQFMAEIRMFSCNFAPSGWALCDGQLMPISQNTALFSLIGTIYGGNGLSTFGLPDMQGNAAMFWGQGPGLSERVEGEVGGSTAVSLLSTEMPAHSHSLMSKTSGGQADPLDKLFGSAGTQLPPPNFYSDTLGSTALMAPTALSLAGGGQPHNNLMPFLVVTFCIALQGAYPQRS